MPNRLTWPGRADRLTRVRTSSDLERLARRRTPRAVFDYVEGGAESEISVRRAREAFESVEFRPHILRDVADVDPSTLVLGERLPLPVILGPTGFTRMMHSQGEAAVARAAGRAGLPYVLSTMGTTSVEALAEAAPGTDRWFQLYLWKDRARSRDLIARVAAAGTSALVLTVDVPVAGARLRDVYNGLTIPPRLTARTLVDMCRHPRWTLDLLTSDPLSFASMGEGDQLETLINTVFDPTCTYADVEWLRDHWPGKLVVKGVQRVDDAKALVACGVDALVVSNHGGRQLDRAVTPLRLLSSVAEALGSNVEVYLDGGVRSGADVAAAIALGARAVFVARPYLYALMAAGERGVEHLLQLLSDDYRRTLQLLGVTCTAELGPDLIRSWEIHEHVGTCNA